jgi:Ca2+-binding RTX toxin-like protein
MNSTSVLALSVFQDPNRSGGQSSGEVGAPSVWSVVRGSVVLGQGQTSASFLGARAEVFGVRYNDTTTVRAALSPTTDGGAERVVAASLRWIDENAGDMGPPAFVRIADWGWQSVGRMTTNADRVVMDEAWRGGALRLEGASPNNAQVTGNAWNNTVELGVRTGQVLAGAGNDTIKGGAGNDTLQGGTGNDSVLGGAGDDFVWGENGVDSLWGGAGNDAMLGGAGLDVLYGGDGNDSLDGGSEDDRLWGGSGNDTLWGGTGNDTLDGGAGNDTLDGSVGADLMEGGEGNDVLRSRSPLDSSADTLYGGAGDDALWGSRFGDVMEDRLGANTFYTLGNDTVLAGDGNDTVYGDVGAQRIETGAGNDLVVDQAASGSVRVFLGAGDDVALGHTRALSVEGGAGHDSLVGGTGNDSLYGGVGNDTLEAGLGGYDRLFGGDGNDVLVLRGGRSTGGLGSDLFALSGGGGARYTIVDFARAQGDRIGLERVAYNALASEWQDGVLNSYTVVDTAAGFELRSTTSSEVITFEGVEATGLSLSWFEAV